MPDASEIELVVHDGLTSLALPAFCRRVRAGLALSWAMDTLEIRRVEAKVFAYNVISINALRRNGFQQEGTLREAKTYGGQRWDILVFSILESEMREQRRRDALGAFSLWEPDARA